MKTSTLHKKIDLEDLKQKVNSEYVGSVENIKLIHKQFDLLTELLLLEGFDSFFLQLHSKKKDDDCKVNINFNYPEHSLPDCCMYQKKRYEGVITTYVEKTPTERFLHDVKLNQIRRHLHILSNDFSWLTLDMPHILTQFADSFNKVTNCKKE